MASEHKIKREADGTLTASGFCPVTNKEWTLTGLDKDAYDSWRSGELIQNAFPNLDSDQRELLVTGYTQEGWTQTFGDEEELFGPLDDDEFIE